MGMHCHQPVDNFGHIFEKAYTKSYKPFLDVLKRHPGIKLSIHYSGSLLSWIKEKHPEFLDTIREFSERGQVEILTGGYHEPILAMIPKEDILGQIDKLTGFIKETFKCDPKGLWLTERVWDPKLAGIFGKAGIKYTIVDDFHLENTGLGAGGVFGRYAIEKSGNLSVFASIKKLRYMIPFSKSPKEVVDYLEGIASDPRARCVAFADDMEKFGLWPHTHNWVYRKGWLDSFFTMIEKSKCIDTMTFSEAVSEVPSSGDIMMPHSSYAEMMLWSGGDFDNFFSKYPESDFMRKRMLYVSNRLDEAKEKDEESARAAREELYKSQSNCAYWHGIFGGVYLKYLRQGIYKHLIKAESLVEKRASSAAPEVEIMKFPGKTSEILCAKNRFLNIFVDPSRAGAIFEVDYKPRVYNLSNTMSRREEPYHAHIANRKSPLFMRTIKRRENADMKSVDLYEVLGVKEWNLKKWLFYDLYPKVSLILHLLPVKTSIKDFIRSKHCGEDKNNALLGDYAYTTEKTGKAVSIKLEKECMVSFGKLSRNILCRKEVVLTEKNEFFTIVEAENKSAEDIKFLLAMEYNWSIEDESFRNPRKLKNVKKLVLRDRYCGATVEHALDNGVSAWIFPLYTLNESESGIGKNFQGSSLLFYKNVLLKANSSARMDCALKVYK